MISQGDLVTILHDTTHSLVESPQVGIIGVTGFPFCGKTTICLSLVEQSKQKMAHIPMEAYVLGRTERADRKLDGCSCSGHRLDQTVSDIQKLKNGSPITHDDYSWELGRAINDTQIDINPTEIVIFDGSAISCSPTATLCDQLFFFRPKNTSDWLNAAIDRDVIERSWKMDLAAKLNKQKAATCDELLKSLLVNPELKSITKVIDFITTDSEQKSPFLYDLS